MFASSTIRSLLLATFLIASCDARIERSCSLSLAPKSIGDAICSGDANKIRIAISKLRPLELAVAAEALLRVWLADSSVGTNLPWDRLTSQSVRLAYAAFLAQSVRNRLIDFPLESFQQFAVKAVRNPESDGAEVEAIYLLGIADTDQEIMFLVDVIKNNPFPKASHVEAIRALARICSVQAADQLTALERSVGQNSADGMVYLGAAKIRADISAIWCSD